MNITKKKIPIAMVLGMLGCLCYGGGDWLMLYGDTAHAGVLYWLTTGAANIAPWRNSLAMFLAFPGIVCYGIALFFMENFIKEEKQKKIYHYLNAFGLTPWMSLHLFYIMILYLFAWMNQNGYDEAALQVCTALYNHLSWIVMLSEVFMLPVFIYWFILQLQGKTYFPKWMAVANVLIIYGVLYAVKSVMPDCAFRIGFTNGLMSESMFVFFLIILIAGRKNSAFTEESGKYPI